MIASPPVSLRHQTIADLLHRLGDVPAERVVAWPLPGTATEDDLLEFLARDRVCELVDGTLVEKPVGTKESFIATILIRILGTFVAPRRLGLLSEGQGPYRLSTGLVRLPDVAFIAWDRLPGKVLELPAIATAVPNLAIEVLSESNTAAEIARKNREYFAAGVELVWIFDPDTRTIAVHTAADHPDRVLAEFDVLDGGTVLPGFRLRFAEVFAELESPFLQPPPAPDGHGEQ